MNKMYGFEGEIKAKSALQLHGTASLIDPGTTSKSTTCSPMCSTACRSVTPSRTRSLCVRRHFRFQQRRARSCTAACSTTTASRWRTCGSCSAAASRLIQVQHVPARSTRAIHPGPMCEMLWSDPQDMPGRQFNKRGVGCQFGPDVTARFLQDNNLKLLIRSHEARHQCCWTPSLTSSGQARGVRDPARRQVHHHLLCAQLLVGIAVARISCQNELRNSDSMGNKGAFITLDESLEPKFTTFTAAVCASVWTCGLITMTAAPSQRAAHGVCIAVRLHVWVLSRECRSCVCLRHIESKY